MFHMLRKKYQVFKTWGQTYRILLLILAALTFVIGVTLSIRHLGLTFNDISYMPILIIVFVLAPVSALFNGVELCLCGQALKRHVHYKNMLAVSTSATVANVLPLPAGLLMRGAALVRVGASVKQTSYILLLAGLMWMSMAATVSAYALTAGSLQIVLSLTGLTSILIIAWLIKSISSLKIALGFLAVRAIMISILIVQLKTAFAAIDQTISYYQSAIYVVSGISAAIVSIVPAGLGLVEGTAAALAKFTGESPAAAFIALSLNRILALVVSGALAWGLHLNQLNTPSEVQ